jgi:hypothetical protein
LTTSHFKVSTEEIGTFSSFRAIWIAISPELLLEHGYIFEMVEPNLEQLRGKPISREPLLPAKFPINDPSVQTGCSLWFFRHGLIIAYTSLTIFQNTPLRIEQWFIQAER